MNYHSTRCSSQSVNSARAVLNGLAPDGGLYMPEHIPHLDWQKTLEGDSLSMATDILSALLPDIPHAHSKMLPFIIGHTVPRAVLFLRLRNSPKTPKMKRNAN